MLVIILCRWQVFAAAAEERPRPFIRLVSHGHTGADVSGLLLQLKSVVEPFSLADDGQRQRHPLKSRSGDLRSASSAPCLLGTAELKRMPPGLREHAAGDGFG